MKRLGKLKRELIQNNFMKFVRNFFCFTGLLLMYKCDNIKSKKLNSLEKLEIYTNYKKFEKNSFLLIDKKLFNKIKITNYHLLADELLDDLKTKKKSNNTYEINSITNFLFNVKKTKEIDKNNIQKLVFYYIIFKCDLLFQENWYLAPRYFFSSNFIDNYNSNGFFCEYKEKSSKNINNELCSTSFFQIVNNEEIKSFIKGIYPKLYHGNGFSNFDPVFLKCGFVSSLSNDVLFVKINNFELKKIMNNEKEFKEVYLSEKCLLELERKCLPKLFLIDNILFDGHEIYGDSDDTL